jgi:pyruvate dehydrogenase (quinone)/pyruvate oxidase
MRIEDPAACGSQIELALETPGPVVVEAIVDPFEPPMPAAIKAAQAVRFGEALARGEPDRGEIIRTVLKDRIKEMV